MLLLIYFFSFKFSIYGNQIMRMRVGGKTFRVEVVSDASKKQLGLGKREGICAKCGMLFVFDSLGHYSFWMKDMRFPLDLLWLSGGHVVHIEKNVSKDSIKVMSSGVSADSVLELNAGTVDSLGISKGSEVTFL